MKKYQVGMKVLSPFRFNIFMNDYTNVTYEFHLCDNRNRKNSMKIVSKSLWGDGNGGYADD